MFKDYSNEFSIINDQITTLLKRIDLIDKNIGALSDDINHIKKHLGLEWQYRKGKRHIVDINDIIEQILKNNPTEKAHVIFSCIEDFLAKNDNIENGLTSDGKNEGQYKKYELWRERTSSIWLDKIEALRDYVKMDSTT